MAIDQLTRDRAGVNVGTMLNVSFVILTLNEEANLEGCVSSLQGVSDDISVLDSGSMDGTVAIAERLGVPIYQHAFTGFGDQRNWATDNIPTRYDWVFHLDADERFTPELAQEISEVLTKGPAEAGYLVANRLILGGKWLKYSSCYPVYQVRLFHRDRMRFENYGHGQKEIPTGTLGVLQKPYDHLAFSKGLQDWLQKHVVYAKREAQQVQHAQSAWTAFINCLLGDRAEQRRALKQLTHKLPCRGVLRMFYLLVIKRGLLDGKAGVLYAIMLANYERITATFLWWNRIMPNDAIAADEQT